MNTTEKGVAPMAKAWVKPELKRISAGSAENGPPNEIPDGDLNSFTPS